MADDDEDDFDRRAPNRLLEWRIHELEKGQTLMSARIEKLATREDVQKIETKIDDAAAKKADRSFSFWAVALAGPTLSGIVVGVVLFVLLHQQAATAVTGR